MNAAIIRKTFGSKMALVARVAKGDLSVRSALTQSGTRKVSGMMVCIPKDGVVECGKSLGDLEK